VNGRPWRRSTSCGRWNATGNAAVTFGGDMVDIAHEETARTMLAIAKEMGIEGA